MGNFVKVAKTNEIAPGSSVCIEAEGKQIALFNLDGSFFALANNCNHKGGPLSEGKIENDKVTCPWHGAAFDIKTGKNLCPPATREMEKFNVRIAGDDIEIEV